LPEEPKFYFLCGKAYLQLNKNIEAVSAGTRVIKFAQSGLGKSNLLTMLIWHWQKEFTTRNYADNSEENYANIHLKK
jgi:hypothetical protein